MRLSIRAALVACAAALVLVGCDDFEDVDGEQGQASASQEQMDDRAQKAANDAIDNTGGMNVDYGN